jgi:hypothetical protein
MAQFWPILSLIVLPIIALIQLRLSVCITFEHWLIQVNNRPIFTVPCQPVGTECLLHSLGIIVAESEELLAIFICENTRV